MKRNIILSLLGLIIVAGVGFLIWQNKSVQPQNQESSVDSSDWIAFSKLPAPPPNTQIVSSAKVGGGVFFTYDGSSDPRDPVIPSTDSRYPDPHTIRITTFFRSDMEMMVPTQVDLPTLEVSTSQKFLKDKNHVYYLSCEGLSCAYDVLEGADPQSFKVDDMLGAAHDKSHKYHFEGGKIVVE